MTSQGMYSIVVGGSWNNFFVQYYSTLYCIVVQAAEAAVERAATVASNSSAGSNAADRQAAAHLSQTVADKNKHDAGAGMQSAGVT